MSEIMPKKIEVDSKTWKARYQQILEEFAPTIKRCPECGSPTHDMFVCQWCDYNNGNYEEWE